MLGKAEQRPDGDEAVMQPLASKNASLIVPLPRPYAEALHKRSAAYNNWQQIIQDADLTDDELAFLSSSIEQRFQTWLSESGLLKELQLLDTAATLLAQCPPSASRLSQHLADEGEDKTVTPSPSPSPAQRRLHHQRRQISPTTAI